MNPTSKGILYVIGGLLFITGMDAVAKALSVRVDVLQIVWARYTGQTLIVFILLARRLPSAMKTDFPKVQLLRSAAQFGATLFFFYSLSLIGLAEATALVNIIPVFMLIGAALFLGETFGARRAIAVAAALVGATIIAQPTSGVFTLAALLPIGAAFCYTTYALATRYAGRTEDPMTSLFYSALFGAILINLMAAFFWQPVSANAWIMMAAVAILGSIGQFLTIKGYATVEASIVAPFTYVSLIMATFWGIMVFGEYPTGATMLGALVIAAAGLYVWHRETRIKKRALS